MNKKENRKKLFTKGFFIGLAITFAAEVLISVAVFLFDYHINYYEMLDPDMFSNMFMIPSVLCVLFYLLVFVSNNGAFDAIIYSTKLVFYSIFSKNTRHTKLPKTYGDYRAMKMAKERSSNLFLLFAAIPFLIVGIVFTVLSVTNFVF